MGLLATIEFRVVNNCPSIQLRPCGVNTDNPCGMTHQKMPITPLKSGLPAPASHPKAPVSKGRRQIVTAIATAPLALALAGLGSQSAYGQTPGAKAVVERLRSPAWVERNGRRTALAPGMQISELDKLITGADARLLVRLPEGSAVVLGQNSTFTIETLSLRKPEQASASFFSTNLRLFTGILRYATAAAESLNGRNRDVQIRTVTATIGVRGTRFWAEATPNEEVVCLSEGKVDVERVGEPLAVLDRPNAFWIAPAGQPARPVGIATETQIRTLTGLVALTEGSGLSQIGGSFKLRIASFAQREAAGRLIAQLQARGYGAQLNIQPASRKRQLAFEAIIAGLASEADARSVQQQLSDVPGAQFAIQPLRP
jgi:hypothetical protein